MKILFIIDSLGAWGKERQLVELLKGLDSMSNFETKVVLLTNLIHYEEVLNLRSKIHVLERKQKKDLSIYKRLYNICKDFTPDVIHSWERMCTVYALPVAKLVGAKFINGVIQNATPNPKKFGQRWLLEKITFPFSDVIVSNTEAGLRAYKIPSKKSYYVHNGYDFLRLKNLQPKEDILKKFKIFTPLVVGMVGRFDSRKDYKSFIGCALQILQYREDVTFVAVGDGSNARGDTTRSIFELCKNMVPSEFKERIIFTGLQTNVESIINVFSVGVLLTNLKVHGEGVSNSIMEYMALGKPVIATLGGGTPEIVEEEVNGFLIQNNDTEQLIEKLEVLLDNRELAVAMGKKGKEKVQNEFNLEVMTQNFVHLYKNLLGENSS
ncbi:MAG: glycosyltransferase [Bacteroidetes bacterium]|nr:glycosyltransferase [Bacteroidota bacterium]